MKILFLSKKDDLLFRDNMLAIATQTAIDYPYISLILSTGENRADYEKCFEKSYSVIREGTSYGRQNGLEYLVLKDKMNEMTQEEIDKVFVPVVDNHLYYLPEAKNSEKSRIKITDDEQAGLVNRLDEYADIVYVNCTNEQNLLEGQMADAADLIIFGIDAHLSNCDELLLLPARLREKCLFLFSGYEACSSNNITRLIKYYRLEEDRILAVPSNSIFSQASMKGKGEEFIKRCNFSKMTTGCSFFINQLKRSASIMMDTLDF